MDYQCILKLLHENNALNISFYQNEIIVASGETSKHVRRISEVLIKYIRNNLEISLSIEGMDCHRWVLLDLGVYLIHVFREDVRNYYEVDSLWGDKLDCISN